VRDAVAARDGRSRYRRLAIWNGAGSGRAQSTLVQPFGSVGAVRFSMAQSPLPHGTAIAAPVLITSAKAADNRSRFMFMTRCSFRDPVAWGSRWPYAFARNPSARSHCRHIRPHTRHHCKCKNASPRPTSIAKRFMFGPPAKGLMDPRAHNMPVALSSGYDDHHKKALLARPSAGFSSGRIRIDQPVMPTARW